LFAVLEFLLIEPPFLAFASSAAQGVQLFPSLEAGALEPPDRTLVAVPFSGAAFVDARAVAALKSARIEKVAVVQTATHRLPICQILFCCAL